MHFALYGALPLTIGVLRKVPLIVHFHGPWAEESRSTGDSRVRARLKHAIERAVYSRADRVIVLSFAFKRLLVENYGIRPWDVTVVRPGVDRDRFTSGNKDESRASLGLPSDAWICITVRRLVPRMGFEHLLQAWRDFD